MPDPWDALMKFNDDGSIEILDKDLAEKINNTYEKSIRGEHGWIKRPGTLKIFSTSDTVPHVVIDSLCVCK